MGRWGWMRHRGEAEGLMVDGQRQEEEVDLVELEEDMSRGE